MGLPSPRCSSVTVKSNAGLYRHTLIDPLIYSVYYLFIHLSLQTLESWTRSCLGWPLWVSQAVCPPSSLTPSAPWKLLCSTLEPAPSALPALWSSPSAAPLQPIPTQQKPRTTYQVRGKGLVVVFIGIFTTLGSIYSGHFKVCHVI